MPFKLRSEFQPQGDQPAAIEALVRGLDEGAKDQVLLGITGSGKTFTVATVIERTQRPTLVIAHNKTLAAQLYQEFKYVLPRERGRVFRLLLRLLPARGVRPGLRHLHREGGDDQRGDRPPAPLGHARALRAARRDRRRLGLLHLRPRRPGRLLRHAALRRAGDEDDARAVACRRLVELQYERSDIEFDRGTFRVRGDVVEVYPELSGPGLPHRAVGRRDRLDLDHRPAARRGAGEAHVARCPSTRRRTT